MNLANFNFAQPYWLLLFLLLPFLLIRYKLPTRLMPTNIDKLRNFIDDNLTKYLLIKQHKNKQARIFSLLYFISLAAMIIALANPRWNYTEFDTYKNHASMVIILDLSASMEPFDRVRHVLQDILDMSRGVKIGLIGFAANPHLIAPITDDINTLKMFLPAIDTDLISKQGDNLAASMTLAEQLLNAEPSENKSMMVISNGGFKTTAYKNNKIKVYVLGVGRELNKRKLQDLAKAGRGMYVEANYSDQGVRDILNKISAKPKDHQHQSEKMRSWDDKYYLFLLPAMIIILYLSRKRMLYALFIGLIFYSMHSSPAYAFEWQDWFKNSEQIGAEYFIQGNFDAAANAFNDPYHRGVAFYRAGKFAEAEQSFLLASRAKIKTAALYNAGNAQMQQKKWRSAVDSYEKVLSVEPNNQDAKHNLELAMKMLEKEPQCENNCDNSSKNKENKTDNTKQQQQNQQQLEQKSNDNNDSREQQWLNRIESDIKVFLRNKFYVEDILGT